MYLFMSRVPFESQSFSNRVPQRPRKTGVETGNSRAGTCEHEGLRVLPWLSSYKRVEKVE